MSVALALAMAMLCGCSAGGESGKPQVFSWQWIEEPAPVAPAKAEVDLEDDGIEAQQPPPKRVRLLPDDPTQPWSKNYGAGAQDRVHATRRLFHTSGVF